jgi:hypothetical protein
MEKEEQEQEKEINCDFCDDTRIREEYDDEGCVISSKKCGACADDGGDFSGACGGNDR